MPKSRKKLIQRATLKRRLGITEDDLAMYLSEGLPVHKGHKNGLFDQDECIEWLERNALADPPDTVVFDIKLLAKKLGVTAQAVRYWQDQAPENGFPGRPGYYPIRAIREWRDNHQSKAGRPAQKQISDDDRRYKSAKAELAEISALERRGDLVRADLVERKIRRSVARTREIIRAWPELVAKRHQELGKDKTEVKFERDLAVDLTHQLIQQIHRDLVEHAEEDIADDSGD